MGKSILLSILMLLTFLCCKAQYYQNYEAIRQHTEDSTRAADSILNVQYRESSEFHASEIKRTWTKDAKQELFEKIYNYARIIYSGQYTFVQLQDLVGCATEKISKEEPKYVLDDLPKFEQERGYRVLLGDCQKQMNGGKKPEIKKY